MVQAYSDSDYERRWYPRENVEVSGGQSKSKSFKFLSFDDGSSDATIKHVQSTMNVQKFSFWRSGDWSWLKSLQMSCLSRFRAGSLLRNTTILLPFCQLFPQLERLSTFCSSKHKIQASDDHLWTEEHPYCFSFHPKPQLQLQAYFALSSTTLVVRTLHLASSSDLLLYLQQKQCSTSRKVDGDT